MVKQVVWSWVIMLFTLSATTTGQLMYSPHSGPCFNPTRSLCSCSPLPKDFLVFHPLCKMAKELGDADRLLKLGKRLTHDTLRAFPYEPSLQASLQRLLAALDKFSERVEQIKRQTTQTCPPWYLRQKESRCF